MVGNARLAPSQSENEQLKNQAASERIDFTLQLAGLPAKKSNE